MIPLRYSSGKQACNGYRSQRCVMRLKRDSETEGRLLARHGVYDSESLCVCARQGALSESSRWQPHIIERPESAQAFAGNRQTACRHVWQPYSLALSTHFLRMQWNLSLRFSGTQGGFSSSMMPGDLIIRASFQHIVHFAWLAWPIRTERRP